MIFIITMMMTMRVMMMLMTVMLMTTTTMIVTPTREALYALSILGQGRAESQHRSCRSLRGHGLPHPLRRKSSRGGNCRDRLAQVLLRCWCRQSHLQSRSQANLRYEVRTTCVCKASCRRGLPTVFAAKFPVVVVEVPALRTCAIPVKSMSRLANAADSTPCKRSVNLSL